MLKLKLMWVYNLKKIDAIERWDGTEKFNFLQKIISHVYFIWI